MFSACLLHLFRYTSRRRRRRIRVLQREQNVKCNLNFLFYFFFILLQHKTFSLLSHSYKASFNNMELIKDQINTQLLCTFVSYIPLAALCSARETIRKDTAQDSIKALWMCLYMPTNPQLTYNFRKEYWTIYALVFPRAQNDGTLIQNMHL